MRPKLKHPPFNENVIWSPDLVELVYAYESIWRYLNGYESEKDINVAEQVLKRIKIRLDRASGIESLFEQEEQLSFPDEIIDNKQTTKKV